MVHLNITFFRTLQSKRLRFLQIRIFIYVQHILFVLYRINKEKILIKIVLKKRYKYKKYSTTKKVIEYYVHIKICIIISVD